MKMQYPCLMLRVKEKVQIFVHLKQPVPHILMVARNITSKSTVIEICGDRGIEMREMVVNEIEMAEGRVMEEEMIGEIGTESELVAEEEEFQTILKIYAID